MDTFKTHRKLIDYIFEQIFYNYIVFNIFFYIFLFYLFIVFNAKR